jgi:hypothetical protein
MLCRDVTGQAALRRSGVCSQFVSMWKMPGSPGKFRKKRCLFDAAEAHGAMLAPNAVRRCGGRRMCTQYEHKPRGALPPRPPTSPQLLPWSSDSGATAVLAARSAVLRI